MTLQEHRGKIPRIHRLATEVLKDERFNNEEMFVSDFLIYSKQKLKDRDFLLIQNPMLL